MQITQTIIQFPDIRLQTCDTNIFCISFGFGNFIILLQALSVTGKKNPGLRSSNLLPAIQAGVQGGVSGYGRRPFLVTLFMSGDSTRVRGQWHIWGRCHYV